MGKPIIEYRKSELYDQVVDEYDVFTSSYDFLIFLAVVGYRENRLKQNNYRGNRDEGTRGEIGLQNVYSNDLYRTIMACLALQESGSPDALVDSSMQMRILAQYAAGGLEVAEQEFGDVAGDPTDAIVNYIERFHDDNSDHGGELDAIVKSFDDEMLNTEG